jgi:hypothetical protein
LEDFSIGALANFADQLIFGCDIEHLLGTDHALDEEIGVLRVFVILLFAHRRSSHMPL